MMRCAVFGCDNTDGHRFPENPEEALKWKISLKLDDFPSELMYSKFTVCRAHFRDSDYEDKGTKLNETAIPTLMEEKGSDALMQKSTHSTASTNNTDICVLETHESHYGEEENQLEHSIDAPDFTVLHAPQRHHSYAFDESTEVLLIHSETNDKSSHNAAAFSGTDSDVEVLMSEDIIDSDWSAGAAALEEFEQPEEQIASPASTASLLVRRQESATDQDISVEEFSRSSMAQCELLTRSQLLNVIAEQATRIRQLEATLQRYRSAQQSLFDQVDSLRLEFGTSMSMEFNRSHETIN